jgi:hypothetical protein
LRASTVNGRVHAVGVRISRDGRRASCSHIEPLCVAILVFVGRQAPPQSRLRISPLLGCFGCILQESLGNRLPSNLLDTSSKRQAKKYWDGTDSENPIATRGAEGNLIAAKQPRGHHEIVAVLAFAVLLGRALKGVLRPENRTHYGPGEGRGPFAFQNPGEPSREGGSTNGFSGGAHSIGVISCGAGRRRERRLLACTFAGAHRGFPGS